MTLPVIAVPLLILEEPPEFNGVGVRLLDFDDPLVAVALRVEQVGFHAPGTAVGVEGRAERDAAEIALHTLDMVRERIRVGTSVAAVAETDDGPVAVGTLRPLGDVAEIVAVATLPVARRQGLAAAITSALVQHALERASRRSSSRPPTTTLPASTNASASAAPPRPASCCERSARPRRRARRGRDLFSAILVDLADVEPVTATLWRQLSRCRSSPFWPGERDGRPA